MVNLECPACKRSVLQRATLEQDLAALRCPSCEGVWIDSNEYLSWLKTRGPASVKESADEPLGPILDTQDLKLCPSCKRILARFRVVPDIEFYVERCKQCNGVWLDRDEWKLLVSRRLYDKVNQFFTQPWQSRIREEEVRQKLNKLYLEKFGPEDYARIQDTWEWLKNHPQQSMLLAFLQSEDPYKI
jgi:Zn-finger nucleic acid-binding protein